MRPRNTPNDDHRKERIVTAAIAILKEEGIERCTARNIAQHAGIPLGSVSYHFASKREILLAALRAIARMRQHDIEQWAATAQINNLEHSLAKLILEHSVGEGRALTVVTYELYVMGMRDPEFREISQEMFTTLERTLTAVCGSDRARRLAPRVDGVQMDILLHDQLPTVEHIAALL